MVAPPVFFLPSFGQATLPVSPCFQPLCEAKLACPLAGGVCLTEQHESCVNFSIYLWARKPKVVKISLKRSLLKNKAEKHKTLCNDLQLFIC